MQRDLLINLFTVFVISTITTEFPSMSETAPNVAVSSGYSRESNVCWMPASVAESSPGDGASVSTKIAMWVPTAFATAPTVSIAEQVRLEQTLNARTLPTTGGDAVTG